MGEMDQVKRIRIVVIDDDTSILQYLSTLFAHAMDAEVAEFSKPQDALAYMRESQTKDGSCEVDAVLSDMMMPHLSGHDFLIELRSLGVDVPVVFLSGHLDRDTLADALRLGAFDVVAKPPQSDALIRTMEIASKVGVMRREIAHQLAMILEASGESHSAMEPSGAIKRAINIIRKNQREINLLSLRNYALTAA